MTQKNDKNLCRFCALALYIFCVLQRCYMQHAGIWIQ